jgi:cytosine/adenosine deaminase-related metal-dependent hydrolase
MFGTLVTLPVRAGLKLTELAVRSAQEVVGRVAAIAGLASKQGEPPVHDVDVDDAAPPEAAPPPPEAAPPPPEDEVVEEAEFTADYDTPTPAEPVHVSEGAELVEEVAEPGAEDGAGAQVHVAEPWDGYRELKAADVIDRLVGASSAEVAAIELFELAGRKRQTIIAAAQRELSRRN